MDADVVVIGAGVIGLAIAARLAEEEYSVILLEKESNLEQVFLHGILK